MSQEHEMLDVLYSKVEEKKKNEVEKKGFIIKIVSYRHMLPRELVDAPSLETLKVRLPSHLVCMKHFWS